MRPQDRTPSLWDIFSAFDLMPDLDAKGKKPTEGEHIEPDDIVVLLVLLKYRQVPANIGWVTIKRIGADIKGKFSDRKISRCLARLKAAGLIEHDKVPTPDPLDPRNRTGYRFAFKVPVWNGAPNDSPVITPVAPSDSPVIPGGDSPVTRPDDSPVIRGNDSPVIQQKNKTGELKRENRNPPEGGDPFSLPDWIPAESWNAFLDTRRAKGVADTPAALRLIVKELDRLRGEGNDPGKVLDQTVRRGWKDVSELPAAQRSKTPPAEEPLQYYTAPLDSPYRLHEARTKCKLFALFGNEREFKETVRRRLDEQRSIESGRPPEDIADLVEVDLLGIKRPPADDRGVSWFCEERDAWLQANGCPVLASPPVAPSISPSEPIGPSAAVLTPSGALA